MPRVIAIQSADDIPAAVAEAQEVLSSGRSIGLPGTTSYCSAIVMPESPTSVDVLAGYDRIAVHSLGQVIDLVPSVSLPLRRLLGRCWPGPLVLEIGSEAGNAPVELFRDGFASVTVPAHPLVQSLTAGLPRPLLVSDDSPQILSAGAFAEHAPDCELVLDAGKPAYDQPASVVRMTSDGFEHVRPGILSQQAIDLSSCRIFLFVCTGNTCRSPLAEGLFRNLVAERLQCGSDELEKRGVLIQSAGLAAAAGSPASSESVQILSRRGVDIGNHASQPLTEGLLEMSDHIFTMTRGHFDAIVRYRPEAAGKVEVLRRDGSDVVDPIGGGMSEYERCEREIEESLMAIIATHFPQE